MSIVWSDGADFTNTVTAAGSFALRMLSVPANVAVPHVGSFAIAGVWDIAPGNTEWSPGQRGVTVALYDHAGTLLQSVSREGGGVQLAIPNPFGLDGGYVQIEGTSLDAPELIQGNVVACLSDTIFATFANEVTGGEFNFSANTAGESTGTFPTGSFTVPFALGPESVVPDEVFGLYTGISTATAGTVDFSAAPQWSNAVQRFTVFGGTSNPLLTPDAVPCFSAQDTEPLFGFGFLSTLLCFPNEFGPPNCFQAPKASGIFRACQDVSAYRLTVTLDPNYTGTGQIGVIAGVFWKDQFSQVLREDVMNNIAPGATVSTGILAPPAGWVSGAIQVRADAAVVGYTISGLGEVWCNPSAGAAIPPRAYAVGIGHYDGDLTLPTSPYDVRYPPPPILVGDVLGGNGVILVISHLGRLRRGSRARGQIIGD